ncbi:MAG: hypothetical protein JRE16_00925, partial [Deltaproteobacteria bacterium]|nr:hypothetical protein [Deltaproteobacteria bacterium]
MQSSLTTTNELFDLIDQRATVLTATNRLSRYLLARYDENCRAKGWAAWRRPAILPLKAWVADQAGHSALSLNILTTAQELHLWETVIKKGLDPLSDISIRVPATASKASEAYRLLRQFNTSFSPAAAMKDHRAFHAWQVSFEQALKRINYVSQSDLVSLLNDAIAAGKIKSPELIVCAGFDDLTPDLEQLFGTLQSQGSRVLHWSAGSLPEPKITQWPCLNPEQELHSCARWVRGLLESGAQNIGVLAPSLNFYQEPLERIFRAELDPRSAVFPDDKPDVFNLSLGKALDNEGIIQAALRLLTVPSRLHYEDVSWLLRSTYLSGSESEASARAQADRQLRKTRVAFWSLDALIRYLKAQPGIKLFIGFLHRLKTAALPSSKRSFGTWAEAFLEFLTSCGWPGERSLSSRELQAVLHFKEALGQLAGLDPISGPVQRSAAAAKLSQSVADLVFQPETEASEIQIMGFLEASGLVFEHLWVLGMTDDQLPATPDPNPFLPVQLQRLCGM